METKYLTEQKLQQAAQILRRGGLLGILGMLLGVPTAAALYRMLREDVVRREKLSTTGNDDC